MNRDDIPLRYRSHPSVVEAFERAQRDRLISRVARADREACLFWHRAIGVFLTNLADAGLQAWRKDVRLPR